jgi:hypothetical protein
MFVIDLKVLDLNDELSPIFFTERLIDEREEV